MRCSPGRLLIGIFKYLLPSPGQFLKHTVQWVKSSKEGSPICFCRGPLSEHGHSSREHGSVTQKEFVPSTYFIEHHWKSLALLVVSPKLTAAVQKDSAVQILIGPPGVGKYKLCCPVLECRDNANGSPNAHKYHSIGTVLRHWLFPLPVGLYIQHMASISRCLFLP